MEGHGSRRIFSRISRVRDYNARMEHAWPLFRTIRLGMHWTGIVFGLGAVQAMGYWTTDFLVVQARAFRPRTSRSAKMAPDHRFPFSRWRVTIDCDSPGVARSPRYLPMHLVSRRKAAYSPGQYSYKRGAPASCWPATAGPGLVGGLGITCLLESPDSWLAWRANVERLCHRLGRTTSIVHFLRKTARPDQHYVFHGTPGCTLIGLIVRPSETAYLAMGFCEHHGLRTGTVRLLHTRLCSARYWLRNALEARKSWPPGFLGACWRERFSLPSLCLR